MIRVADFAAIIGAVLVAFANRAALQLARVAANFAAGFRAGLAAGRASHTVMSVAADVNIIIVCAAGDGASVAAFSVGCPYVACRG
jgi:hypothetical protein